MGSMMQKPMAAYNLNPMQLLINLLKLFLMIITYNNLCKFKLFVKYLSVRKKTRKIVLIILLFLYFLLYNVNSER